MNRKLVYIISPYAGEVEKNVAFAIRCCRMAIGEGHTPIAVHLLYPQILNDLDPAERAVGLEMGLQLLHLCSEAWVCGKRISCGMEGEIQEAQRAGIPIRYVEEVPNAEHEGVSGTKTGDGTKLAMLHIGAHYTRAVQVPAHMTAQDITGKLGEICEEAKAAGNQCLMTELPNEAFAAKGIGPCGIEDIHAAQRDLREELMAETGLGDASCWECYRLVDATICGRYDSIVDENDADSYRGMDCCINQQIYQLCYSEGTEPRVVDFFILRDEKLLDDVPGLLQILARFFPETGKLLEDQEFDVSKVRFCRAYNQKGE